MPDVTETGEIVIAGSLTESGEHVNLGLTATGRLARLYSLAISGQLFTRSLSDAFNLSDVQTRLLAKALTDNGVMSDVPNRTLSKSISDRQDISDALVKKLSKIIGDSEQISDSMTADISRFIAKYFIDSMFAGDADAQGKITGSKFGISMTTEDKDPMSREHGGKGRRQK